MRQMNKRCHNVGFSSPVWIVFIFSLQIFSCLSSLKTHMVKSHGSRAPLSAAHIKSSRTDRPAEQSLCRGKVSVTFVFVWYYPVISLDKMHSANYKSHAHLRYNTDSITTVPFVIGEDVRLFSVWESIQALLHPVHSSAHTFRHPALSLPVLWQKVPPEVWHEETHLHTHGWVFCITCGCSFGLQLTSFIWYLLNWTAVSFSMVFQWVIGFPTIKSVDTNSISCVFTWPVLCLCARGEASCVSDMWEGIQPELQPHHPQP